MTPSTDNSRINSKEVDKVTYAINVICFSAFELFSEIFFILVRW